MKIHIELMKSLPENPEVILENLEKELEEMDEAKTE